MALQTFYFDMKGGVPVRDRIGKRFALNAEAIAKVVTMNQTSPFA